MDYIVHGVAESDMTEQLSQGQGKDPDAGKDWRQKEKRVAEEEMFG